MAATQEGHDLTGCGATGPHAMALSPLISAAAVGDGFFFSMPLVGPLHLSPPAFSGFSPKNKAAQKWGAGGGRLRQPLPNKIGNQ